MTLTVTNRWFVSHPDGSFTVPAGSEVTVDHDDCSQRLGRMVRFPNGQSRMVMLSTLREYTNACEVMRA